MLNIKNTIDKLRLKQVLVGLFVFSVISLLIAAWFRSQTNKQLLTTKTTNPDGSIAHYQQVKYSGEKPLVPESLNSFVVSPINYPDLIAKLQIYFQINSEAKKTNIWSGEKYTLTYSPEQNKYLVFLNSPIGEEEINHKRGFSGEEIEVAKELVAKILPDSNLVVEQSKISYLAGGGELMEVGRSQALWAVIPFVQKVEDYPLFQQYAKFHPVEVMIDSDLQITKVIVRPPLYTIGSAFKQKTLSIDQAINQIRQGNASIIDSELTAENLNNLDVNLNQIAKADLSNAMIEYRVNPQTNRALPFYKFNAKLLTVDGGILQAKIITPATILVGNN